MGSTLLYKCSLYTKQDHNRLEEGLVVLSTVCTYNQQEQPKENRDEIPELSRKEE